MRTQSCRSDTLWRKVVRWLLHKCYTVLKKRRKMEEHENNNSFSYHL